MKKGLYAATPVEVLHSKSLSLPAKVLFSKLALSSGYPKRQGESWYSEVQLAEELNIPLRTIQRAKGELRNAGLVEWHRPKGKRCHIRIVDPNKAKRISTDGPATQADETSTFEKDGDASLSRTSATLAGDIRHTGGSPIHYMKHKTETSGDTPEGPPQLRSNMKDCMTRSSEYKKRNPINDAKRHTDRHAERVCAKAARSASKWRGAGFLVHMNALCDVHGVEPSTTLKGPALVKNMNLIIKEYEDRGIDCVKLADIMTWVISSWTDNLEVRLTSARYPDISIFTFRWHIKSIINLYTNAHKRTTPLKSTQSNRITDADLAQF